MNIRNTTQVNVLTHSSPLQLYIITIIEARGKGGGGLLARRNHHIDHHFAPSPAPHSLLNQRVEPPACSSDHRNTRGVVDIMEMLRHTKEYTLVEEISVEKMEIQIHI